MLPLSRAPRSLCILRLSAIGDTCHVVPVIRTLQKAWPDTRLTWVIGKSEARLMSLLEGVELITVDKRAGLAGWRGLRTQMRGRRFDVLLHMQLALRASVIAREIPADVKLGFDRGRARELQWLFTNARIAPASRQHVLDSFFGFTAALGIPERTLRWDLPLPADAQAYAQRLIPDTRPTLVISPCSSHVLRNWAAERYAAVADYAAQHHGMRVILAGGPTAIERDMGAAIERYVGAATSLTNQIGRDTLPQLLALLARATVLLAPDSGPVHMATMAGTPVIGLYAATNPQRSGPYLSRQWCVDAYGQAALRFCGKPAEQLPWTRKIEQPGVMDLIGVEQVTARIDELLRYRP
ncbi:MAG TPA: glycosyltransferase family 9 protein [Steroidobacteraceae bacterium]|nr:glycosyltransferase family 9 protein [Steroidobacteraceae bacterium]